VHFSYLGIHEVTIEYCTLIDKLVHWEDFCRAIWRAKVLVKWYTSLGLILAFWGFIIDFIMGPLLLLRHINVRSIEKKSGWVSHEYRRILHRRWRHSLVSLSL
jgi:hypothetical protein